MLNNNAKLLQQKQKEVKQACKELLTTMGVEARNHFVVSFRNQGFTDESLEKWEPRKSKRDNEGRNILVKTGNLKNSIRVIKEYITGIIHTVIIGTNVPYAQIHNEGGTIQKASSSKNVFFKSKNGKTRFIKERKRRSKKDGNASFYGQKVNVEAHSIQIPKREFMGDSKVLMEKIKKIINKKIMQLFNNK